MLPALDIFRVTDQGELLWKTTAETLESAQRRIKILMTSEPGDYVIYNHETGARTVLHPQKPA
jgi:hypothetical protein